MWRLLALLALLSVGTTIQAQDDEDEDIWKSMNLSEVDFQKSKNYCMRIYGYYRYIDDGVGHILNRQQKIYRVYEGICELDVRYSKDEDDGANVLVGRDLVHPDKPGRWMEYYELKPYTFLEKARRLPKTYTMQTRGDTTRVSTKKGPAGYAVTDRAHRELRMYYNALSPDTAMTLNLLIIKAHLSHIDAEAVYQMDDDDAVDYVPQGSLKHVTFEGDLDISMGSNNREVFHERTELYVDSVVYMTKDEWKADKRIGKEERRKRAGYAIADIDRLKKKLGVPPLTAKQLERIEDQRDWDDEYEQWRQTDRKVKAASKATESGAGKKATDKLQQKIEKAAEKAQTTE
ncbi:MAG: hypothetical protein IKI19_03165 [Prevotella sp.]|nr:hypothetical protein [Prevotella sp.]